MTGNNTPRIPARELFEVPDSVRILDPEQLLLLEESFRRWRDEAARPDSRRARDRMYLIFLLLRHTGARLGEVLDLDDRRWPDRSSGAVALGREEARRLVPLPGAVLGELTAVLDGPSVSGNVGSFFRADPGYVRRTFYARADDCGVDRSLATPRVLRNTRAVEMLRSGVPMTVVREALGQSSLDLTSVYQKFTEGDVTSILKRFSLDSVAGRTSARNTFIGHVTEIASDAVMADVRMRTRSGLEVSAIITTESLHSLGLERGTPVAATVKAPHVNVFRGGDGRPASARNSIRATVSRVRATAVLTEIAGELPDGSGVCALVSSRSAEELDLREGDDAEFRFKALSVVLSTV